MMDVQTRVCISADCLCDLPPEIRKQYRIPVMYCYIHTEEARFRDGKEISVDNLVEYIEEDGKRAYSGPASAEEYREFFEGLLLENSGEIIHICISKDMSGEYEAAVRAAYGLERIHVVDSGHLSGGMGLLVLAAAEMAYRGAGCELILAELEKLKRRVVTSFVVDSTEFLYRNEKISERLHSICSMLSLHPVLKLSNGKLRLSGICIGNSQHFAKAYIKKMLRGKKDIDSDAAFLITAGCSGEYQRFLKTELKKRMCWDRLIVNEASASITCNCGSGGFGVLYVRKKPKGALSCFFAEKAG